MDLSEIKNNDLLATIKDLTADNIQEIYEISKPNMLLKKLILSVMVLLDFEVDWQRAERELAKP